MSYCCQSYLVLDSGRVPLVELGLAFSPIINPPYPSFKVTCVSASCRSKSLAIKSISGPIGIVGITGTGTL